MSPSRKTVNNAVEKPLSKALEFVDEFIAHIEWHRALAIGKTIRDDGPKEKFIFAEILACGGEWYLHITRRLLMKDSWYESDYADRLTSTDRTLVSVVSAYLTDYMTCILNEMGLSERRIDDHVESDGVDVESDELTDDEWERLAYEGGDESCLPLNPKRLHLRDASPEALKGLKYWRDQLHRLSLSEVDTSEYRKLISHPTPPPQAPDGDNDEAGSAKMLREEFEDKLLNEFERQARTTRISEHEFARQHAKDGSSNTIKRMLKSARQRRAKG